MEKETVKNAEIISEVIKNGVEAGLKIASKHYHLITDLHQLIMEKEKVFRMLGEQVFQMIDQGRIFAPAIMQATFRTAKEILERIARLEEGVKSRNKLTSGIKDKEAPASSKSNVSRRVPHQKLADGKRRVNPSKGIKDKTHTAETKKINTVSKKKRRR